MKENGVVCMHNCLGEQNCQLFTNTVNYSLIRFRRAKLLS